MDSKATKSSHPTATHHEVSADTDSTLNRSYLPNSNSSGEPKHARPGEDIMKSDDPSTAALRYVLLPLSNSCYEASRMGVSSLSHCSSIAVDLSHNTQNHPIIKKP